ncbi:MAG: NAD(P)-binding domain-containing protein [Leptolyngbya sp. SIO3F4]|nr:NAD(P)-binding domain-containing protein [Leptolyngbya sp. SIO3F4]
MNIGIIGSGMIGSTLGRHWAKAGHAVFFSSRHPEDLEALAEETGAQLGSVKQAAAFGSIVLLAVPFGVLPEVAEQMGPMANKVLIDACNPYPNRDGDLAQQVIDDPERTSTGYTASLFPDARVVKAFNSVYFKVLAEKAFRSGDERIAVQVASDDAAAKKTVVGLIESTGYAPHDLGELANSTYFEPDAVLYNRNLPIRDAEELLRAYQER